MYAIIIIVLNVLTIHSFVHMRKARKKYKHYSRLIFHGCILIYGYFLSLSNIFEYNYFKFKKYANTKGIDRLFEIV